MKSHLIIDASNIHHSGGGFTHLKELISHIDVSNSIFDTIEVFASDATLSKIIEQPWLIKHHVSSLNGNYFQKWLWRLLKLPKIVRNKNAILFIPGTGSSSIPYVTMCQNLLPLELEEMNRYFLCSTWIRILVLRIIHLRAYKRALGVIFLTKYSKKLLVNTHKISLRESKVIPHGINKKLFNKFSIPAKKNYWYNCSGKTLNIIYVSTVDLYKHQWNLVRAVINLRKKGLLIHLDLIGGYHPSAYKKLLNELQSQNNLECVCYHGEVSYGLINKFYANADAFIFGSSCEAYGMVLTEAMAMGLPILCSNLSSMSETVGDAGIYFNPLNIDSTMNAIELLYQNPDLFHELKNKSIEKASKLSWEKCANDTLQFLSKFLD